MSIVHIDTATGKPEIPETIAEKTGEIIGAKDRILARDAGTFDSIFGNIERFTTFINELMSFLRQTGNDEGVQLIRINFALAVDQRQTLPPQQRMSMILTGLADEKVMALFEDL
jgi:hypothetical protein